MKTKSWGPEENNKGDFMFDKIQGQRKERNVQDFLVEIVEIASFTEHKLKKYKEDHHPSSMKQDCELPQF